MYPRATYPKDIRSPSRHPLGNIEPPSRTAPIDAGVRLIVQRRLGSFAAITPGIKHALSVEDACAAQKCGICFIVESARKFCGPSLQVSHMRYRLKFGDAFAAQKNQIYVTGENAAKFVAHNSTEYQHALSAEVWRRFCGQICIIGEGAAKLCGP